MKVLPVSQWDEEYGPSIFVSFSRDKNGKILGEPPELYWGDGDLDEDFDPTKWTHFIDGDFNFVFEEADPISFPRKGDHQ